MPVIAALSFQASLTVLSGKNVMGNSFSSGDLKALIQSDLGVDIAFPLFPVGRSRGSSACCVVSTHSVCIRSLNFYITLHWLTHCNQVDTEWLENIKSAKLSNGQQISVRKPSYLSSRVSPADKKHAITVNTANIYISVLTKDPDAGNRWAEQNINHGHLCEITSDPSDLAHSYIYLSTPALRQTTPHMDRYFPIIYWIS